MKTVLLLALTLLVTGCVAYEFAEEACHSALRRAVSSADSLNVLREAPYCRKLLPSTAQR